ncbi:MAG TPA: dienelactone hydrolase family protein, partial [Novosphingobium sp.]|nr:dienelactone hydrolase family protein [Novosphingobium sp.]
MAMALAAVLTTGCAQSSSSPTRGGIIGRQGSIGAADLRAWRAQFEAREFQSTSGMVVPYRIAAPPAGTPRPLVLVLHGKGEMGSDNRRQLTPLAASWVRLHQYSDIAPIIVAPQVDVRSADYDMCGAIRCASRPGPSFEALLESLYDITSSEAVDASQIHMVGFSMGGATAMLLALARPELAAGLTIFGAVPPHRDRAPELTGPKLHVVQGTRDWNHPLHVMQDWIDGLNAAGGNAVLEIRDGMKHKVPGDMVVDKRWRLGLLQPEDG